jgi:hypothetical protein
VSIVKPHISTLNLTIFLLFIYGNGLDQRVARQRLCGQGPSRNNEEVVFSADPTAEQIDWLDRDQVICLL